MSIRIINNNRGDTIIEVLISIMILSLVLAGAYRTANASLNNVTDAQERTQAMDIAQNQLEDLRANAALPVFNAFKVSGSTFCFNSSNNPITYSAPTCKIQTRYTVTDTTVVPYTLPSNPDSTNVGTYKVLVKWPAINNNGNNQLVLFYRVAS